MDNIYRIVSPVSLFPPPTSFVVLGDFDIHVTDQNLLSHPVAFSPVIFFSGYRIHSRVPLETLDSNRETHRDTQCCLEKLPQLPNGLTSLKCSPTFPSPDPSHLYELVEFMSSLLESHILGNLFIFSYCPQAQCSGSWLPLPCSVTMANWFFFSCLPHTVLLQQHPHLPVSPFPSSDYATCHFGHLLPSLSAIQVKKPPDSDSTPHFFPLILVAAHNHSGTSWSRMPRTSMLCGMEASVFSLPQAL